MMQNLSKTNQNSLEKNNSAFSIASNYFLDGLLDLTVQTIIVYNNAKKQGRTTCLVMKSK